MAILRVNSMRRRFMVKPPKMRAMYERSGTRIGSPPAGPGTAPRGAPGQMEGPSRGAGGGLLATGRGGHQPCEPEFRRLAAGHGHDRVLAEGDSDLARALDQIGSVSCREREMQ